MWARAPVACGQSAAALQQRLREQGTLTQVTARLAMGFGGKWASTGLRTEEGRGRPGWASG
jgi:hypothetical protein